MSSKNVKTYSTEMQTTLLHVIPFFKVTGQLLLYNMTDQVIFQKLIVILFAVDSYMTE